MFKEYNKHQEKECLDSHFPNGFESWKETYFEIVSELMYALNSDHFYSGSDYYKKLQKEYDNGGRGRMYELTKEWTDEFEKLHEDKDWDGEFYDKIDNFLKEKIK